MLLSLKIQFFFFFTVQSPSHRVFSTSRHLTFMRQPERYARRKNSAGNYRRVERSGKEKGERRGRGKEAEIPTQIRETRKLGSSISRRKEGRKFRYEGRRLLLLCIFDTSLFLPPSHFLYLRARGEGYRVLGTRLYRYRTPPRHDGGGIS